MKEFDVIVVWCWPAGVAASLVLEKNNINYCIIDRCKFPREKLCGGAISNKSIFLLNQLGLDIENLNVIKVKEVRFVANNVDANMKLNRPVTMVDRLEFDNNNIKQIANDNLYEWERVVSINDNVLTTDKNEYGYKYIIFADGVNWYSKNLIENREFGFCVEYDIDENLDNPIFDFTVIDSGYGWIFPKNGHITIGLGTIWSGIFDIKNINTYLESLCKFGEKYNYKIDKNKIKAYPIPIFSKEIYMKSVIDNKYILVGDAACLVDKVSWEWIYYALSSWAAAAESIICSMRDNIDLQKAYLKKTRKIYSSLKKRAFLSKLLYSKYGSIFIKIGLSNRLFINKLNSIFW